ncbi:MAG: sodium/hydrogen exchanger [Planctomycetota bacterium]|nr:MAG: sodium/hydrogen exchanger [Planctomycetota bacterium]
MPEFEFLRDLVVVFGLGVAVVFIFTKLRLPSLIGFLATGAVVGPYGLQLVHDRHSVELLAEIGIVILLFAVGVEFSLGALLRLGRVVLLGGTLQVVLTGGAAALAALALGLALPSAVLVGFIVALSSTAIVMRLLTERGEATTPQGRIALGILIFQDLAVVPMVLAIPLLAGSGGGDWKAIGLTLLEAVGVVVAVLVVARSVVPRVLHFVVATRSRELFLFSMIVICLGTAWLTSELGLSLALGAFLAGLVVSESEYAHHALGTVLPFRDAFSSLFFVSIGMLLDAGYFASHAPAVAGSTLGIVAGKAVIAAAAAVALGYPARIGALAGLLLAQIGEFSFLLLHLGGRHELLPGGSAQLLLAATVLSMAATPLLVRLGPAISDWVGRQLPAAVAAPAEAEAGLDDHVVIVGYGVNGQNVARALEHVQMPYVVIEMNPETVRRLRRAKKPVLYGDATQPLILEHAGIARARVVVVTVPDAASARRIVEVARHLNPAVRLIVRTRLVGEVAELYRLGAHEVVPEEFETAIEIVSRVLRSYLVPYDVIERLVRELRREGYGMFREERRPLPPVGGLGRLLGEAQLEVFRVQPGSPLAGRTLAESGLAAQTGALVLAVHRAHKTTASPPASWRLEPEDIALVLGSPEALAKASALFGSPGEPGPG